jgi:thioredoxin reductase
MTDGASTMNNNEFDVVVIGGGAAGLNGALILARSRRSVLVIDAGEPRNAPADGVHGFLSRDGLPPAELQALGRAEVERYGGQIRDGRVETAVKQGDGFRVTLAGGQQVRARRLLVTTGLVDELPTVPGVRERWGRDVLHCPYCHGWEVRDQAIGILATSTRAMHQALLFRQLSTDVIVFAHTAPPFSAEDYEQLAALEIKVVDGEVARLEVEDDRLVGVRLVDGTLIARTALVVGTRMVARSDMLGQLGLWPTEHPMGFGEYIAGDPTGLTEVPGVWVAGNVKNLSGFVVAAAAEGALAGAAINADLATADAQRAVRAARTQLVSA